MTKSKVVAKQYQGVVLVVGLLLREKTIKDRAVIEIVEIQQIKEHRLAEIRYPYQWGLINNNIITVEIMIEESSSMIIENVM